MWWDSSCVFKAVEDASVTKAQAARGGRMLGKAGLGQTRHSHWVFKWVGGVINVHFRKIAPASLWADARKGS